MAEVGPRFQKDFSTGMISNVSANLAPQSSVNLLLNMDADVEIGSLTSRLGTAQIGSQLVNNKSILGLAQHVDQADTSKNLLIGVINDSSDTNSDIWDVDDDGEIDNADFTNSLKMRFLNYQGDTLALNGTDNPEAFNGSSWITTGGVFDLANMPTGYKYPKEFLDRVYLWGKSSSPYTLAYSGVLSSGTVSWTSGNGTVEIEPEDNGGEPTGLGKVPGYILIFKRRSMHRWNYSSAFPESLIDIGAYSQESIVETSGVCAFYSDSNENAKGFYVTDGRRPVPISHDSARTIKKWVDAISSSATVAGYGTERYFAWSVGNLTVDGETYNNVVLKYNRILNQWSVRTYPTQFTVFAHYVTSGVHSIVGGDDDGNVIRVDKASTYTDTPGAGGTAVPIPFKVRTHHNTWGFNQRKSLERNVIVRGSNIPNLTVSAILDEDLDRREPMNSPTFFTRILKLFNIGSISEGTTIAIEIAGESTGATSTIREIEYPSIDVKEMTYA